MTDYENEYGPTSEMLQDRSDRNERNDRNERIARNASQIIYTRFAIWAISGLGALVTLLAPIMIDRAWTHMEDSFHSLHSGIAEIKQTNEAANTKLQLQQQHMEFFETAVTKRIEDLDRTTTSRFDAQGHWIQKNSDEIEKLKEQNRFTR